VHNPEKQCAGLVNFVDLAGSERMSTDSQSSKTLDNEAKNINLSLLCLKSCIVDQFKKV